MKQSIVLLFSTITNLIGFFHTISVELPALAVLSITALKDMFTDDAPVKAKRVK